MNGQTSVDSASGDHALDAPAPYCPHCGQALKYGPPARTLQSKPIRDVPAPLTPDALVLRVVRAVRKYASTHFDAPTLEKIANVLRVPRSTLDKQLRKRGYGFKDIKRLARE